MTLEGRPLLLWALLALGCLGSLHSAWERLGVERAGRQVTLALDYDALLELAARDGVPVPAAIEQIQKAGINAVGLPEMTLERLRLAGQVAWLPGEELLRTGSLFPTLPPSLETLRRQERISSLRVYVWGGNGSLMRALYDRFRLLLGEGRVNRHGEVLEILGRGEELKEFGLGIYLPEARFLESHGFLLVPRIENKDGLSDRKIRGLFETLDGLSTVTAVIFSGLRNEVLGYRPLLQATADELRSRKILFGFVEIYDAGKQQKGARSLVHLLPTHSVRVQTIPAQQLAKIDPERALEMWGLGVRERNIRLLYLRPFPTAQNGIDGSEREEPGLGERPIMAANLTYFRRLAELVRRQGFEVGRVEPFPPLDPSRLAALSATLAVGSVLGLLLHRYRILPFPSILALIGLLAAGTAAAFHFPAGWGLWSKGMALLAGVLFPVWGSVVGWGWLRGRARRDPGLRGLAPAAAALGFMGAAALLGGLVLAAFLRGNVYLLGGDQFRGVKLLLLFSPLLAVLLLLAEREEEGHEVRLDPHALVGFLESPLLVRQALLFFFLLGAAALLVLRSGNIGEEAVPEWERIARSRIESVLLVRPRFKEFLIGYPAVVWGSWGIARGHEGWGVPAAFLTTIGLASTTDTFAHLHTPLWVGLLRSVHGIWVGLLLGGMAWGGLSLMEGPGTPPGKMGDRARPGRS